MEYENMFDMISTEQESQLDSLREEVERTIQFISYLSSMESHNSFPDDLLDELKYHVSCLLEIIRESLRGDLDQEFETVSIH